MGRDLKEDFFRLDGAWASFELTSIREREDYLKPFRVLRCRIDDQVDFQAMAGVRNATEASVLIEVLGQEEHVAAEGRGPVHAVDNAMRKVLERHYPQLSEVRLEEFEVRLLHHGAGIDDARALAVGFAVHSIAERTRDRSSATYRGSILTLRPDTVAIPLARTVPGRPGIRLKPETRSSLSAVFPGSSITIPEPRIEPKRTPPRSREKVPSST